MSGDTVGCLNRPGGGPRTATVRTTSACVLLTLGRDHFLRFIEKHPSAAVHMLAELGRRHRELLEMLRGVQNANTVMEKRLTTGQHIADRFGLDLAWAKDGGEDESHRIRGESPVIAVDVAAGPFDFAQAGSGHQQHTTGFEDAMAFARGGRQIINVLQGLR